jgi:hypothetical protein
MKGDAILSWLFQGLAIGGKIFVLIFKIKCCIIINPVLKLVQQKAMMMYK